MHGRRSFGTCTTITSVPAAAISARREPASRSTCSTRTTTDRSSSYAFESAGDDAAARVTVRNRGHALAFQVRLQLVDPSTGAEILPAFWDDNYFELLPDEQREIRVTYPRGSAHTTPIVTADAW